MATENERVYLGESGTERLVARIKTLLSGKQDIGSGVFTDRTTGTKYILYVDNGKLQMEPVNE